MYRCKKTARRAELLDEETEDDIDYLNPTGSFQLFHNDFPTGQIISKRAVLTNPDRIKE